MKDSTLKLLKLELEKRIKSAEQKDEEIIELLRNIDSHAYTLEEIKKMIGFLKNREGRLKNILPRALETLKLEDADTNGLYLYTGGYNSRFSYTYRDDVNPRINTYWNLELPHPYRSFCADDGICFDRVERTVLTEDVPTFEKEYTVFSIEGYDIINFYLLQQELLFSILELGNDEAVKRFVKKYENKRKQS